MSQKIPVTVLGATGTVGQRLVRRLAAHPRFVIAHLAASERSAHKRCADAAPWRLDGEPWAGLGERELVPADPERAFAPVVFSALDSEPARAIEPAFAAAGAVVLSNASTYRMAADVPLLVPEVNPTHLQLVTGQRAARGWRGALVTNPNCTTTVLVMALAPLHREFGVERVLMTSLQAVSGAGYPGVPSLDILGNVVPHIRGEEEKVEEETAKLLGTFAGDRIAPAELRASALCHRVPVLEGHTEAVSVTLRGDPDPERVSACLREWRGAAEMRERLPSAPPIPIRVHAAVDRPQVRRDVEEDGGMSVHVGRIRRCPVLGIKFSLLGHNTERGAAGGAVLNAEWALAAGVIAP